MKDEMHRISMADCTQMVAIVSVMALFAIIGCVLLASEQVFADNDSSESVRVSSLASNSDDTYAIIEVTISGEIKAFTYTAGKPITIEPNIDREIDRGGIKYVLKGFKLNEKEFNFVGYVPKAGTTIQVEACYDVACVITLNYVSGKTDLSAVNYGSYSSSHTYYAYLGEDCYAHVLTNDEQARWFNPSIGYNYTFKGWFDKDGNPWDWKATGNMTLNADYDSDLFPSYSPVLITKDSVKDPIFFNATTDDDGNLVCVYYIGTATDVLLGTYWEAYNSGGFSRSESESETEIRSVSTYVTHSIETSDRFKISNTHEITEYERALISGNVDEPVSSGANRIADTGGIDISEISSGLSSIGAIVSCIPGTQVAGMAISGVGGIIELANYVKNTMDTGVKERWERIIDSTDVDKFESHEKRTSIVKTQEFKYAPVGSYLVYGVFGGVDYYQMEKYSPNGDYLGTSITYTTFDAHDAYYSAYCPNSPDTGANEFRVDVIKTFDISKEKMEKDLKKFMDGRDSIIVVDDALLRDFNGLSQKIAVNAVMDPSIESIETGEFKNCASLVSIVMPSVKHISGYAFSECGSLKSVTMPVIESIDDGAFSSCPNLIANSGIKLNKGDVVLQKSESISLTVLNGSSEEYKGKIIWNSSNPKIVTVSDGEITAKSGGSTTVSAYTQDGKIAICNVNVDFPESEEDSKSDDDSKDIWYWVIMIAGIIVGILLCIFPPYGTIVGIVLLVAIALNYFGIIHLF